MVKKLAQTLFLFEKKVAVVMTVDKDRPGNAVDVERILNVLPKWGYGKVINVKNATKAGMVKALKDLKKLDGVFHVN